MEIFIVLILGLIAYLLWDIQIKINYYFKQRETLDLDCPFYSVEDIKLSKFRVKTYKEIFEDAQSKMREYFEKHKEEINKVKKNKNHTKEYKEIMSSYFHFLDELNSERKNCNEMQEANYAICSGKKTFKQIGDSLFNRSLNSPKPKESSYDNWLEY